jgi:hypothetical protein
VPFGFALDANVQGHMLFEDDPARGKERLRFGLEVIAGLCVTDGAIFLEVVPLSSSAPRCLVSSCMSSASSAASSRGLFSLIRKPSTLRPIS